MSALNSPREQAIELHRQGIGNREIARRLNRSSSTIFYWINQEGRERIKQASNERYHSLDSSQRNHRYELNRRRQLAQFGITPKDYNKLLEKQGNSCKICKRTCSTGKKLAVDHCHQTGMVRGLLCASCNTRLGFIESYLSDQTPWDNYLTGASDG